LPPLRFGTIVLLYGGDKPAELRALLGDLQVDLADAVGAHFLPRPVDDIHATLIGLESGGPVTGRVVPRIDVDGLCRHLDESLTRSPLKLRFGGFADRDHSVSSRGSSLYERALTVSGSKVVLIGWPVDGRGEPTWRLEELRRELGRFGARHRYHPTPDPDAYLVIGELLDGWDPARLDICIERGRWELSQAPCEVQVTGANAGLAIYTDTRLPAESTVFVPHSEAGRRLRQRRPPRLPG
jgi:hypothetical protein